MEFRILGPVEVGAESGALALGPPKQRALLALLLTRAGRTVTVSEIVDALWEDCPPAAVRNQVQVYVSALRRVFAAAGAREVIVTRPTGYQLRTGAAALDLHEFEADCREACALRSAGRTEEAVATWRAALGRWRGPALDGVEGRFAEVESRRLEERRVAALEQCLDGELALGRHAELVAELTALVGERPLHEGLRRRLMLALAATGRQAEALAAFREGRRALVDELGIEPGPDLRALHEAILTGDPVVTGEPAAPAAPAEELAAPAEEPATAAAAPYALPCELPRDVSEFVGRTGDVEEIRRLLRTPRPVVVTG